MAVAAAMTLLDRLLDAVPTKISYAMRAEPPVSEGAFHFSVIVPNPATTLVNIPARRRSSISTVIQVVLPRPLSHDWHGREVQTTASGIISSSEIT